MKSDVDPETRRLEKDASRDENWKRWGPYLADRQWGTVREDYSAAGDGWSYFTHEQSRSRAYRWGEDGLMGFTDRQARLCFGLALWNGKDAILKERLFGLTNNEGNHGEDVKESYFYLDATPTYSYAKALYKYPQEAFPYAQLLEENRRRGHDDLEFELADTGIFDESRYFDCFVEYAKGSPDDVCIRITLANRGPETAKLDVLPTLWFRNTWCWGRQGEGYWAKPKMTKSGALEVSAEHSSMPKMRFLLDGEPATPELLFTENETNAQRLFRSANASPYVKDAFHDYVVHDRHEAVNPKGMGTKFAARYRLEIPAGKEVVIRLRLTAQPTDSIEQVFQTRIEEADRFYSGRISPQLNAQEKNVSRQAYAGLLWSKQFYNYIIEQWRQGDPGQPVPPAFRPRNEEWPHVYSRDVLSMPDKWEYPWFAAWDLAFHMVAFAEVDPYFAKDQLLLLLREWYMHPNGQIPAYEFDFGDVNPPVHAWAAWRVYKIAGKQTGRDKRWLARVFQKLLINFTWWVNRKDADGNNLFSGGFLGLDNIGLFDRSKPLPTGGQLKQADGTAWMAFYASTMLAMALELAKDDPTYEDMASKFFEHFVHIVDAMNTLGGTGLWNEEDGFYYDQMQLDGQMISLKTRSMVGLIPLFAVEVLESDVISKLPGFQKRLDWFLENRADLAKHIAFIAPEAEGQPHRLLAVPSRERLERVLRYLLDQTEFFSDNGVRALSRYHLDNPFALQMNGMEWRIGYVPGEGNTGAFGGNSNWRGPVWFPLNYLLLESLQRYHHFYGDGLKVECPRGSGKWMNLREVSEVLAARLTRPFLPDGKGHRPCHGGEERFATDPHWKDLVLFHEYFHGDSGRGLGAAHQTGWTALVVRCLEDIARRRQVREPTRARSNGST